MRLATRMAARKAVRMVVRSYALPAVAVVAALGLLLLLVIVAVFSTTTTAPARAASLAGLYSSSGCLAPTAYVSTAPGVGSQQLANAKIVLGVAKAEGLPELAGEEALDAAIDESSLTDEANPAIPASLDYPGPKVVPDYGASQAQAWLASSVGLFQQQVPDGWSTLVAHPSMASNSDQAAVWQLMTPAYATEAFLGTPPGSTFPPGVAHPQALQKGLLDIHGGAWALLNPVRAVIDVQHPSIWRPGQAAYPDSRYAQVWPQAQTLAAKLWGSVPPVPPPVPFTPPSGHTVGSEGGVQLTAWSGSCAGVGGAVLPGYNLSKAHAMVQAALAEVGRPYVWGGGTPTGPSGSAVAPPAQVGQPGFDCSGLVLYALGQVGVLGVPHYTVGQFDIIKRAGLLIQHPSVSQLEPGFLLYYAFPGDGTAQAPGHVRIYIGHDETVAAPETGYDVRVRPLNMQDLVGAGPWPALVAGHRASSVA